MQLPHDQDRQACGMGQRRSTARFWKVPQALGRQDRTKQAG
jgi:hypothetical protein